MSSAWADVYFAIYFQINKRYPTEDEDDYDDDDVSTLVLTFTLLYYMSWWKIDGGMILYFMFWINL